MTFIRVKPGHEIDPIDLADRFQVNLNPGRPNRRPPGIGIAVDGFLGFTAAFTVGSGDRPVQSQILRFSIFLRGQHLHGGDCRGFWGRIPRASAAQDSTEMLFLSFIVSPSFAQNKRLH